MKVVFRTPEGVELVVPAVVGRSVMQTAVDNSIDGIVGECGGNASCATCHVWVHQAFVAEVGPAEGLEDDLLDLAVADRREGSRLGCQIELTPALDGLVVEVPPEQP